MCLWVGYGGVQPTSTEVDRHIVPSSAATLMSFMDRCPGICGLDIMLRKQRWKVLNFAACIVRLRVPHFGATADCRSLALLGMTIHGCRESNSWTDVRSHMDANDVTIREAGSGDLETILHHRRSMFRDMGEGSVEELDRMVEVARPWLARALADGSYRHCLAIDSSSVVAGGGGVLLSPWPANPHDPCTERAVILNVYTEIEFRRRGIARRVMQTILAWIRAYGLQSVNLHASEEGRALYEKLGFVQTNEMRLRFGIDE